MIEKLLLMPNDNNLKTKIKNNPNFLLFLLKTEKNPIKLLKELNLDEKEIKNLISKLPKELQNKLLSKIDIKKELKLPISNKKENLKEEKVIETIFSSYPAEIKNQFNNKNTKEKIISIIKKEIEYKIKNSKIPIPQQNIEKLKKIKTFKELVSFAEKLNLNIKKIIISKQEEINKTIKKEPSKNSIPTIKILEITKQLPKSKVNSQNRADNNTTTILEKIIQTNKNEIHPINNITLQNKKNLKISNVQTTIIDEPTSTKKIKKTQNLNNNLLFELLNEKTKENIITKKSDNKFDIYSSTEIQNNINDNLINTNLHQKIISAKQTLTHFSNSLKEAIENYKPPISKISIELNPKELGKVEVTLIHRGENLQIHINSNQTQTINFFNTNQNELKNILVNMGYSEVNMSFNSNQQQKQKDTYKQNQNQFSERENEEFIIEIPYFYA